MAKFRHAQTNFTGGEISPQAWGRTDQPWYANAVKTLKNMIPMTAGGSYRRPGTYYNHQVTEGSASYPGLIPFIFSQNEVYLAEMYTIFGGPTKVLNLWQQDGSFSPLAQFQEVAVTGTHPYEVAGFDSGSGYWSPGLQYDEIDAVQWVQNADIMWLVHPNHKPKTLNRIAPQSFTMIDFDRQPSILADATGAAQRDAWPYLIQNTTATTLQPSGTTVGTNVTLTASTPYFTAAMAGLGGTNNGAMFKIVSADGTQVGAFQVTAFTSSTVVTVKVIAAPQSTAALTTWSESAWSDYRGWPSTVCFYESRIFFAGTASFPNYIWCSETDNFFIMSVATDIYPPSPTNGQSGYNFTIASGNATAGAVYSDGTLQYTVAQTVASGTQLVVTTNVNPSNPSAVPASGGLLTKVSGTGDATISYSNFVSTAVSFLGDNPFTIIFTSDQQNTVLWMSSERTVIIGTTGDEFVLAFTPNSVDSGFAVDTYSIQVQTHYGSAYHKAQRAGSELFFISRSDDEVRALTFDYLQQQYTANPIQNNYRSYPVMDATAAKRFRSMNWDKSRRTMWCLDTSGNLFGLTRDQQLNMAAWHSHQLGGFDSTQNGSDFFTKVVINPPGIVVGGSAPVANLCEGSIVSLAVLPNQATGNNDIWMTVKRKQGTAWVYTVERMIGRDITNPSAFTWNFETGDFFTDCSSLCWNAVASGSPPETNDLVVVPNSPDVNLGHFQSPLALSGMAASVNGIFHLPLMTMETPGTPNIIPLVHPLPPDWADITEDSIVYPGVPYYVMVGFSYAPIIETLRVEAGSQIGSAQGAIKRIDEIYIRFYQTIQAQYGSSTDGKPDPSTYLDIQFRNGDTPMNKSVELYTGDYREKPMTAYDREGIIVLTTDKSLPFAVTLISQRGESSDA